MGVSPKIAEIDVGNIRLVSMMGGFGDAEGQAVAVKRFVRNPRWPSDWRWVRVSVTETASGKHFGEFWYSLATGLPAITRRGSNNHWYIPVDQRDRVREALAIRETA